MRTPAPDPRITSLRRQFQLFFSRHLVVAVLEYRLDSLPIIHQFVMVMRTFVALPQKFKQINFIDAHSYSSVYFTLDATNCSRVL